MPDFLKIKRSSNLFDADVRAERMKKAWAKTREYACGERTVTEFLENVKNDHATDIIESMWGDRGKRFYVNTLNNGAISNLPDDAYLELKCDLDMQGPRPHPIGPMPSGLRGMQYQVLDTHELTAEAAVTGSRSILRRALLCDPICNNIEDVDACIEDLFNAEKEALPDYWF